ncbi:sodium:calcium antiporter [Nesterenkonia sp. PF2B19]|uniref:sodium:calcium antiporter n=1 Tax=Nesterenkonia sp. PF2B19 TaxID=1881858 RepID=UPI0026C8691D
MSILSILLLLGGFVLLVVGGEALVRGAGSLGRTAGLSSLIVGLTVVSFATSSPELAVSTGAALSGAPGLAIGNVVGSNIANILFVLGLTAVFGAWRCVCSSSGRTFR